MTLLGLVVLAVLGGLTVRRLILLAAAAATPRSAGPQALPDLVLVVPACNEVGRIEGTLAAIAALDYPADRLSVVLVDDCSDDRTADHLERWTRDRPRAQMIRLAHRGGKPRAVEAGIAAAPASALVAICDADMRPRPDYLRRVAAAFADETVGGAVGYLAPANALASPASSYAAVESWVHQLVTSAGKDRLDLNPPTLGGLSVFRRAALDAIGGLGTAATGDDVRATVALTRAGWRTRFVAAAVADNDVAADPHAYWQQHLRWARDLYATAAAQRATPARVPLARRIEVWMLTVGYLDRVAVVAAIALAAAGRFPLVVLGVYFGVIAVEVAWAIVRAGAGAHLALIFVRLATFFPLDLAGSVLATATHLLGTQPDRPASR